MGSIGNTVKTTIGPQTFKLTHSAFGNTEYESELFKITKYTHNSAGTSWKETGYRLTAKGFAAVRGNSTTFNTLKEAKEYANSSKANEWYNELKQRRQS